MKEEIKDKIWHRWIGPNTSSDGLGASWAKSYMDLNCTKYHFLYLKRSLH